MAWVFFIPIFIFIPGSLGAVIGPQNPGFEIPAGIDPFQWQKPPLVWPIYSQEAGAAHSGIGAIHCSSNDYYQQTISASASRILTFENWFRADTGEEDANLQVEWLDKAGSTLRVMNRVLKADTEYQYDGRSLLSPDNTAAVRISTRPIDGWVWYDDISIIDDSLANPDLADLNGDNWPDRWVSSGSVIVENSAGLNGGPAARLGGAGEISQSVAVLPFTRATISVLARSDTPNTIAELGFHWHDSNGMLINTVTQEIACSDVYQPFHLNTSTPLDAVWAEISLVNKSSANVWVDEFTYGWFAVKPDPFSPNGDGVRDVVLTTAFFSGVDTVEFSITDVAGLTVRSGVVLSAGELLEWAWDGRNDLGTVMPEGKYNVRLDYQTVTGSVLTATAPVVIASPLFLNPGGVVPNELIRFVWGSGTPVVYRNMDNLKGLKEHGMTDIIMLVFWSPEEVLEILDLAEEAGVKIIFQPWDLVDLDLLLRGDFETAPEDEIYAVIEERYGPVLNHPALRGFFSFDEPFPEDGEAAYVLHRMLRNLAPEKFIYMNLGLYPAQLAAVIQPDVISGDFYPVGRELPPGRFIGYETVLDHLKSIADDQSRDFWMITQAYSDIYHQRMPLTSESRLLVHQVLARAGKGIGYFSFSNPFNRQSTGLIDYDGQETRIYRDIGFLNERLERVSSVILNVKKTNTFQASISSGRIVSLLDMSNVKYVLAINEDCRQSRSLAIRIEIPSATRLVDILSDTNLPFRLVSGGLEFDLILAPGDARYVRIDP